MEKQPAGLDKELQAMGTIGRLLDALDEAQRASILRWIWTATGVRPGP